MLQYKCCKKEIYIERVIINQKLTPNSFWLINIQWICNDVYEREKKKCHKKRPCIIYFCIYTGYYAIGMLGVPFLTYVQY